jgi:peptide/nickel transport system substrate-binding protein
MEEKQNPEVPASSVARLSRRDMLRGIALTAAALAVNQVIAACAPAATSAPTTAPAPTSAPAAPTTAPAAATATTAAPAPTTAPTVNQAGSGGGKVIWAISTGDPSCLAPYGILLGVAHDGKELMYDSLVQWDKDLKVQPALADSWSTPDDKTYIFNLKKGLKFHNGKELDAEDVKYSVELMGGTKLPPPAAAVAQYPAIVSVDVVDKYTAKFNMKVADPTVIGFMAWSRYSSIIPKGFYESGVNPCFAAAGTGPFKLVEYVANDHISMVKFADHWKKGSPKVDELTFKILTDESARVAALRSGAIDGGDFSGDTVKTLKNDSSLTILKGITSVPRVFQFTIKGDGKPWSDKRVRQAMSMAVNRQDIIDKVYGGEAVLTGPIPPGYGDFSLPDATLQKAFKFDLAGAQKLMAEAGMKNGFDITVNTTGLDYQQITEVLKEQWSKIGVNVKINLGIGADAAKWFGEGTFEGFMNGRGMRNDPTGYVNEFGRPDAGQANIWFAGGKGWKNDELSGLYEKALITLDQAARVPLIQRIQEIELDEAPHIYICQPYKFTVVRNRIQGMYVSFTDFRPGLRDISVKS